MKKFLKALALSALIAICAISAAACNGKGVKLVDFPASKTEEVELGSTYTISLKEVKDENGITYRVSASVKTKAGGNVSVFESKFDVTDIEGYVITYTAKIDENNEQTSVVTLNVVDHGKPTVTISKPSTGEVGVPYTLPGIVVSDLSGEEPAKTVEVYFVNGDTETKVNDLTESEGTYSFTPGQAGYYRIKVTATDKSGNTATVTSDFTVDEKVAEGTIFDPASLSALTQVKTSTSCPMEIKTGDPAAAYTGKYVSFTSTETKWHNIYLTPKFELETYSKYDLVEVWLYADAKDDAEVGFSFFNSLDYRYSFLSDTWAKITIDMEDFVTEMGKNNAIFLPFNTNNASSTNHASLTELKLGGMFAKYSVDYAVEPDGLNIEAGAEETEVSLTVSSSRESLPAFTLTLTKDDQVIQPSKTEENVYTFILGAGNYEYKVVSADDMYRGETTGAFVVDYATKIELPEAQNAVAGVAYDIPDAIVYVNGEVSAEKATITASFTEKYTNEKTSGISSKGFVAPSSGVIEIVYSYAGAVSKTMTITVERGEVSQDHALDFTSSDVLENIQVAGGNNVLTYVSEGDGAPYVSWSIKDNAAASWQMFKVSASVSDEVLEQYDYVKVKAMALSDDGVYRWRVLMCSDQYIAGDTAWNAPTRLALNEWGYIYIPMSAFISGGNGFDKKCFVSVTFNKPQDGNADNVKEVRFADFELIKAAEGELVADKLSYTPQENPSFTANVTPDLGYNVEIRQNGETVTTLEKVEGKYVWEGAKNAGTYEAVIVLTDDGYYLQGDFSVTFYITEETQTSNVVFEPTAENAASQIKTSKPCTVEAKTGDPNAAYAGDYVSFSGAGTNVWVNIMLTAESPLEQYAKYDVIEFWIYADAKDNTEVKFSLFNNLAYPKVFKADTWTKLTVSAADFVTEMAEDNLFLPFNMMNANSTNHASLTELRIGAVYAKYSVDYAVETEGLEIADGETADVAITVSCDNEEIPSYELIVSKDGVKQAASSVEGNIHHYTLTAGVYNYSLQATDTLYSGEANGTFTVNSSIKIILPEAAAATAGTAYDIPEAQVSVNGEISGNKAEASAVFDSAYGTEKGVDVPLTGFVAPNSGTITVTYTYAGALEQTLEISVARKPVSKTNALDFSTVDVLSDMSVGADNILSYVSEGEEAPYVSWTIKDNAKKTWQMFKLESELTEEDLSAYAYVKVRVMAVSDGGEYKWRLLLCSDQMIVGEDKKPADEYQSEERLTLNEWHDVYIPMETFLSGGNGFDKKCFISVSFNAAKDGNADNVKEVRFADFALVNEIGA